MNDYYNGCYKPAEAWSGMPHLTNENGAHLYWANGDGFGYWQLDNNEQDGTLDLYDGGFIECREEWYECVFSA